MTALLAQYPFRKSKDIRSAMAETLAAYLLALDFDLPASTEEHKFAAAYDSWAMFEQRALSAEGFLPAVAVLPDRGEYEASSFAPRMLDDTWVNNGRDGHALFAIAEYVVPFLVIARAKSIPQRKAIVSVFEDAFVETGMPHDLDEQQVRYGRLLKMPSYYDRHARFTLMAQQLLDTSETAIKNRWLVQFEITGHAQHCVVRRVPVMTPRVELVLDDVRENR